MFAIGDCGTIEMKKLMSDVTDLFEKADVNKDGSLSMDEFRGNFLIYVFICFSLFIYIYICLLSARVFVKQYRTAYRKTFMTLFLIRTAFYSFC